MPVTIKDIKTILTQPAGSKLVIVKIITSDDGLYGLGCATFTQRFEAVHAALEHHLKPFLIGRDVDRIEEIWQMSAVNSYWRNGPVLNNMAFSAALNGKLDLAIKILEDAPLPVRRTPQVRQNLAFFYGIRGDMKKAGNLAVMDLDKEAVRNNLAVFSRFRKTGNRRTPLKSN